MKPFEEQNRDTLHQNHPERKEHFVRRKTLVVTILVALLLLLSLWIWKSVEISNKEKIAKNERETLRTAAKSEIMRTHAEHLKLLAKPFVWALRSEMMQGNMRQVNLYLADLVKEKNFQNVAVVDPKGIIVATTNKKDEGKQFSDISSADNLNANQTVVQNQNDSLLTMTSPIMGFNSRLGTLYIKYQPTQSRLKTNE